MASAVPPGALHSGTCYYVSPSGNDSNLGTSPSAPWKTIAKVKSFQANLLPGDSVLLQRGGVWSEQWDITSMNGSSGLPITLGAYGTGALPVIDGGYTSSSNGRNYCIDGLNTSYSYIVIDSIECRNAFESGIQFKAYSGGGHHVTVQNSYIHHTGHGACTSCAGPPFDDGGYFNQLDTQNVNFVQFINNVLDHCGGHNCLNLHYDHSGAAGYPLVSGNKVGTMLDGTNASDNFCSHNCIDVKGGGQTAQVVNNYVYCPNCTGGAAYYSENTFDTSETIAFIGNVANQHPNGIELEGGPSSDCTASPCSITGHLYNNTLYSTGSPIVSSSCDGTTGPYKTLDVQKNILDGGSAYFGGGSGTGACKVIWDYNDDGGVNSLSNNPVGTHDLKQVNPQYVNATGGNFTPQNTTILTYGAKNPITSAAQLGAIPPVPLLRATLRLFASQEKRR